MLDEGKTTILCNANNSFFEERAIGGHRTFSESQRREPTSAEVAGYQGKIL